MVKISLDKLQALRPRAVQGDESEAQKWDRRENAREHEHAEHEDHEGERDHAEHEDHESKQEGRRGDAVWTIACTD